MIFSIQKNEIMVQKGLAPIAIILIITGVLAVGGGVWYLYQNFNIKNQNINTPIDETANWRVYDNEELGFAFKYPNSWKDVELIKTNNVINAFPGTVYGNWKGNGFYYFDPYNIFTFSSFSKDYKPYESYILNSRKINVNWSAAEFASNMNIIGSFNVLFVKKLSEKALLAAVYGSPECSPMMKIEVITPLIDNYPNFEISISVQEVNNDPLLEAYMNEQIAKNGNGCDMLGGYQKVAEKILSGSYPELNKNIEIARKIVDSLTLSETASWQIYRNEEYGFEIKYPETSRIKENYKPTYITIYNLKDAVEIIMGKNFSQKCSNPLVFQPSNNGTYVINGFEFKKESGADCGAGLCNGYVSYSILNGNNCITFIAAEGSGLASRKDGESGITITEELNKLVQQKNNLLEQILSTLKFIK